jgi:molybdopterin converting factor small subunit
MRVIFSGNGKIRQLMGVARLEFDMPAESRVINVLESVADRFGPDARKLVLGDRSGLLLLINDEMVADATAAVAEGDEVTVLLPMAGG